jgi:hypothetical protein
MRSLRIVALVAAIVTALGVSAASAAAPPPFTVTGPIPAPQIPGNYEHGYPFFATNHDLATHGYVEEEFFLQGTATEYSTVTGQYTAPIYQQTASFKSGGHPYKTRMLVRRPADPKRFNGMVLVEWYNVTNGFDAENLWFYAWEHILRAGYAWVGVSAQHVGVDKLVSWSSTVPTTLIPPRTAPYVPSFRYNGFTVSCVSGCSPSPSDLDVLSFDIFTQAGQALKTIDMLGGLKPNLLIATGESQSAMRLSTYANQVDPIAKLYDGFLLLSPVGQPIRPDVRVPTFKVLTEWDVWTAEAAIRQDDTKKFHTWEVAGASHVDFHLRQSREPMELRDMSTNQVPSSSEAIVAGQCDVPTIGSRVGTNYVVAAAFDELVSWIVKGAAPPAAPRIEVSAAGPPATIVRDSLGRAEGGIRLAAFEVPVGLSLGIGTPTSLACARWGGYLPFTVDYLNQLYPNHGDYVSAVQQITKHNLHQGYILKPDADYTTQQAVDSGIGKLDNIQVDLNKPIADFDRNP